MFAPEEWMLADVALPYQPCQLFISAIEDSEIIIHEKDPSIALFEKQKLRICLEEMQNRIIMLMSKPAIKRYEHFVQTYPEIVKRVPQKMIASYLGITPEALSKVKSERRRQV